MQPVIVLLLGAWASGIILGVSAGLGVAVPVAAVGLMALVWRKSPVVLTTAVLAVYGLGVVYGSSGEPALRPVCPSVSTLTGTVMTRPDVRENSVRYLVVDPRGCRFLVYAERWPVHERESVIEITGGRYTDHATLTQEQPEFARYVAQQQAAGVWSYPHLSLVAASGADERYRALVERIHRVFVEPDASVVGAILLADRGQFPDDLNEYFRRTSLTHILSISGTHISLLAGMILSLVTLLPWSPRLRTMLVIALLWLYVWFVGAPVSAIRAGFFWSVALVALRLGLLVSLPTAFILTLVLIVSIKPLVVLDIGLQLSFLAVLGIGVALFLAKPYLPRDSASGGVFRGRLWQTFFVATLVSLGATVFTWPLISYYFGLVSLSAVVVNLLVLPSIPVIMAGSMVALVVSYGSVLAGYLVALPVHLAIWWMIKVATLLGTWSGMWVEITVPAWFLAVYFGALLITVVIVVAWQGRSWREIWE